MIVFPQLFHSPMYCITFGLEFAHFGDLLLPAFPGRGCLGPVLLQSLVVPSWIRHRIDLMPPEPLFNPHGTPRSL